MKSKWFCVLLGSVLCTVAYSQSLKPDLYSWRSKNPGAVGTLGITGSPHISIVYDRSGSDENSYILSSELATAGGCDARRWVIWQYESNSDVWTKYHEFPMHNADSSCANYTLLGGGSLAKFGAPGSIRLGVAYAVQVRRSPNVFQTEVHYFQETATAGVFDETILNETNSGSVGTSFSFALRGGVFAGQYISLDYQQPANVTDPRPGFALGLADYSQQDLINLGLGHSMAYVHYVFLKDPNNAIWDTRDVAVWRDSNPLFEGRYAGVGGVSLDMDMAAPLNRRARIAYSRVYVPDGSLAPNTEGEIRYWNEQTFHNFPIEALVIIVEDPENSFGFDSSFAFGSTSPPDSGYHPYNLHQPVSLALDPATGYPYIAYSLKEFTGANFNEVRALMPTGPGAWNPPEVVASQSHGPPMSSPFHISSVADAKDLWVGNLMVDENLPDIDSGRVQLIVTAAGNVDGKGEILLFRRALIVNPPGGGPDVVTWERDAIVDGGVRRPASAALDSVTGRPKTAYYRENSEFIVDEVTWSDGGSLFINAGGLMPVVTGPPGVIIQLENRLGIYVSNDLPPGNYTITATRTCISIKSPNETCTFIAEVKYGLPTTVICIPDNCESGNCGTIPFPGESLAYSARAAALPLLPALAALLAWAVVRRRKVA